MYHHTSYNERFEGLKGEAMVYASGLDNPVIVKSGYIVFVPIGINHRFTS
jgi:mannose-6-phosphate isomerase-like protein (cupin superfamily)